MAPRLDLFSALRIRNAPCQASILRPFSTSQAQSASSTVAQRRRRQDPYALAQAKARRSANISRQEVLRTERAKAYGDPVRGLTTPFLESFDTAQPIEGESQNDPEKTHLNHYLNQLELQNSLQHSNLLTTPMSRESPGTQDPAKRQEKEQEHRDGHVNAREALARIVAIENSSSRDRTAANKQRCIETFGRHNTDTYLKPRPSVKSEDHVSVEKTPRAGPDTGSSEVQISILTAKIRALANFLDTRGKKDVANKRNLRLLVHKRQKLLRYMRTKERGGERWQHLIKTLGLTEGTWKAVHSNALTAGTPYRDHPNTLGRDQTSTEDEPSDDIIAARNLRRSQARHEQSSKRQERPNHKWKERPAEAKNNPAKEEGATCQKEERTTQSEEENASHPSEEGTTQSQEEGAIKP